MRDYIKIYVKNSLSYLKIKVNSKHKRRVGKNVKKIQGKFVKKVLSHKTNQNTIDITKITK